MMQPTKLLENLCVVGISVKDPPVSSLRGVVLQYCQQSSHRKWVDLAYILLLLVHMTNLEPDVFFGKRSRRIGDNVFETLPKCQKNRAVLSRTSDLQALIVLLLLLVDNAKSKVDFVGLLEIRLHAHDLGERFLGMLKRSIAIVEYANTVPQFRLLM